jgi:hypothetical protein
VLAGTVSGTIAGTAEARYAPQGRPAPFLWRGGPAMTATCVATLLLIATMPASAQEKKIPPPPAVIVWKTERFIKDGMALIRAGQLDLALKYAACVVPLGTRAVDMTGGYDSFPVTIIEGKDRGCRGYVMREMYEYLKVER